MVPSPYYYPTPTASPFEDIDQYVGLLEGAVDLELDRDSAWAPGEESEARSYIEDLKAYLQDLPDMVILPVGVYMPYAGDSVPAKFLWCDGTQYLIADYPALAGALHAAYMDPDGLHFTVPDLIDNVPMGWNGDTENDNTGTYGGEATHTLALTEIPAHSHDIANSTILAKQNGTAGTSNRLMRGTDANANSNVTNQLAGTTVSQGGGQAHNNLQPHHVTRYIIRAL